jgi:hypothetical protein
MVGEEEAHVGEAPEEEEGFEDNSEEEGASQGRGQQQQVNYRLIEF